MFTGLVERVGAILEIEEQQNARRFQVGVEDDAFLEGAQIGESISICGACLTATEYSPRAFWAQAVEETLRRTNLGSLREGDGVNLERALKADARLGGHIVQGHIDGVANVTALREEGESWWVTFEPPFELMKFIVEKGSVCLDGISLTVANVAYRKFSVALIPHTMEMTTARDWKIGSTVNVETDILARHVARLLDWQQSTQ